MIFLGFRLVKQCEMYVCWKIRSVRTISIKTMPSNLLNKSHLSWQWNSWSLRCSWSIACLCCSTYIFILDVTPGLNGLGKDNCTWRREKLSVWIWHTYIRGLTYLIWSPFCSRHRSLAVVTCRKMSPHRTISIKITASNNKYTLINLRWNESSWQHVPYDFKPVG